MNQSVIAQPLTMACLLLDMAQIWKPARTTGWLKIHGAERGVIRAM